MTPFGELDPEIHPTFQADITFCFVTAILILVPLAVTRMREGIKR